MKGQIKVAIFGLSLNVLDNIKQKLTSMCEDSFEIDWVTIGDPQLEILLINDMFFGSPTIQNLVSLKQIPYLRLVTKNDKSGSIVDDVMYLPFQVNDQIKNWFKSRHSKTPLNYSHKPTVVQKRSIDLSKLVEEFLNERNGNLQIFDGNGNIGLINTRTEQVWMDHARKIIGTDETLNYTYATMHMTQSVSSMQGVDLRLWLWNMFWYSANLSKTVSIQHFYKLQYWPHPSAGQDRAVIFKIAACFERGASIQQIHDQTGIAIDLLKKFACVALYTQALKEIAENEAQYIVVEKKQSEGVLKGFFGKLRKKLGI